jgi:hypothetical protein
MRDVGRKSDLEGLRLIRAFFRILDPSKRHAVVELAEKLAADQQAKLLHFTLPEDNKPKDER